MLCLKAESAPSHEHESAHDLYPPHSSLLLPLQFSNTIQKYLRKGKDGMRILKSRLPNRSLSSSSSSSSISMDHGLNEDDVKTQDDGGERREKSCLYRSQLEQEITQLQKQLDIEIELHLALASALEHSSAPLPNSSCQLPKKVQELLASIAKLETTVSVLEEELVELQFQLSQERNERRLAEYHLRQISICSPSWLAYAAASSKELISTSCSEDKVETYINNLSPGMVGGNLGSFTGNLWNHPNQLSEEMVGCMRNIFLSLADSSKLSSSGYLASPASPIGHISRSSVASFSDSSVIPSITRSPSVVLHNDFEVLSRENMSDPYQVHGNVKWMKNIGSYGMAAEVSWMSVGEKQLEYAAGALKRFRFLVEQLSKVNPACMSCNEKLAFWINLYNALIMHAYLAYGVPRSDIKLFSLMQKVAYTIGGHSFSAADIEYIILKMKPPVHRPQFALVLALHKFKISDEHRKYSIEKPEPLLTFALSCGMYSSPAVRIYKAATVIEDLKSSMRDYIRASVGISNKGKLLVPKLLHCFAKGVVEDSMLPDWIGQFLSPEQATMVRDCSSQRRQMQRLLSPRTFTILPFDSRFRYLFL